MKVLNKMIIYGCIICILPCICLGQEIPKFAKVINVKGVSFSKAKSSLLDSGYFLEQQSEDDGTLITKEFNADKYRMFGSNLNRYSMIIYVRIKDSIAKVTARWAFNNQYEFSKKQFEDLEYWRLKGSVPNMLFMVLDKYARTLGGDLEYAK